MRLHHLLFGPKGRKYEFSPREDGKIVVQRTDGGWKQRPELLSRDSAAARWTFLRKCGYEKF